MSTTGLEVFDHTVQETNIWLRDVMEQIGPDRQRAYHVVRAVLQVLRDRLPVDLSAHLAAQLPMLVRGIYYEGWRPADTPSAERTLEEFLAQVQKHLVGVQPTGAEDSARAVFSTLARHVTSGAIDKVRHALPSPVRALFPSG